MSKIPLTGVDISTQIPLLEKRGPHWLLWLEYTSDMKYGTYLRLMSDGQIWRETVSDIAGSSLTKVIKPKDKK